MTERGEHSLERSPIALCIGPSSLHWDSDALVFDIDEIAAPVPLRIRGQVRVIPKVGFDRPLALDSAGKHRWQVIAPAAQVEVQLAAPNLRWKGQGYCDSNEGDEPLEVGLQSWHWSRTAMPDGDVILYDVSERNGNEHSLALKFGRDGSLGEFEPPAKVVMPRSGWRISRVTRSEAPAVVETTLDDTPFYVRSVVTTRLLGERFSSVHESLDLDRFRTPLVQAMLPFRMRRRAIR